MAEKKSWARLSRGMPIMNNAIMLDPTAKAMASGAPLRKRRLISAIAM
jgi:hypothetical protein